MASGNLGAAALAAGADTLLYIVPAGKTATVNINCCNRDSASGAKVRLAIGTGGAPANGDYIEYDCAVPINGVLERTNIVCSAGEKVWARADTANVSVRVHGFEE